MDGVTLRIFSGLHTGAEIELTEGVYVIGADDSCDLILSDSSLSARHAALHVLFPEGSAQVTAEPLDGAVILSGDAVPGEERLPARYPFLLGQVIFAWTETASADEAAWQEVEEQLTRAKKSAEPVNEEEKAAAPMAAMLPEEEAEAPEHANEVAGDAPLPDMTEGDAAEAGKKSPRSRRIFKAAGTIAALGLAGLLCFTWQDGTQERTPEQIMRALLDEAGYQKLTVTGGKDSVTVTGRIASDRERGRLLRLAQLLHFPVYLDVTVKSDAADAVRASFNALGLFPEVTELPPSTHPGLLVKGYIKSGVLEEQALTEAIRNVPDLQAGAQGGRPKLALFQDIRHEEDVQVLLVPALAGAGLSAVKTEYQPGRILLRGAFTPQTKASLEEVVAAVQTKLGVPAPFDIINSAEIPGQTKTDNIYTRQENKEKASAAAQQNDTGSSSFQVSAVSMGPMKFITLKNGERVFEGGELPGGYVLEKVSVDELTLTRNNTTTLYPLRGSHD